MSTLATIVEILIAAFIVLGPIFRAGEESYTQPSPVIDVPAEAIAIESQVETEPSHDEIVAAAAACPVTVFPGRKIKTMHEIYACCPLSCAPSFTTRELKSAIRVMGNKPVRNGTKAQLLSQYWSLVLA